MCVLHACRHVHLLVCGVAVHSAYIHLGTGTYMHSSTGCAGQRCLRFLHRNEFVLSCILSPS